MLQVPHFGYENPRSNWRAGARGAPGPSHLGSWETVNPMARKRRMDAPQVAYSRLMSEAMHAAPKPLSMLTTETFGEQVFNMPSSAAMPLNDAP